MVTASAIVAPSEGILTWGIFIMLDYHPLEFLLPPYYYMAGKEEGLSNRVTFPVLQLKGNCTHPLKSLWTIIFHSISLTGFSSAHCIFSLS